MEIGLYPLSFYILTLFLRLEIGFNMQPTFRWQSFYYASEILHSIEKEYLRISKWLGLV